MSSASSTGRVLRLTWPFGRSLLLAAALLALLAAGAEAGARLPPVRARLSFTSTDNPNPEFDQRLAALDQQVARHGPPDCVVIGSSLVAAGFAPEDLAAAWPAERPAPDCFNFGIPGLVAQQAGPLARLLVTLYHPRRLIFGTSMRDYSAELALAGYSPATDLAQGAWLRYRLGEGFSLDGWLVDHSLAYRALLGVRRRVLARPPTTAPPLTVDLTQPPDPVVEAELYAAFADYAPSAAGLDGLRQVLEQQAHGTQVYVVEMPVHATYAAAFPHGQADLDQFSALLEQRTLAAGAVFWSAERELAPTLTNADFNDRHHLSASGRRAFSAWLAGKLAAEAAP